MLINRDTESKSCADRLSRWLLRGNESLESSACPPDFDKTMCWNEAGFGDVVRMECPFEFCSDCPIENRFTVRTCSEGGQWSTPNYAACKLIYNFNKTQCVNKRCAPCPDDFWDFVRNLTLALSIISVLLLVMCLIIFSAYRSLQCARNSMHKHLSVAFIIRFVIFTTWLMFNRFHFFDGCAGLQRNNIEWLCKVILVFLSYSTLASMHWMFVEGVYLAAKVSLFAMHGDGPMAVYWFIGWGLPFFWVTLWALLMESMERDKYCWIPYTSSPLKWVLLGPMFIVLAINVLLLVVIVIVIIRKISADNVQENKKLWRTVKATLFLVPLLGVANLLFLNEPSSDSVVLFRVYIILQAVMEHSQGISIAVLYCFLNTDVRQAVSRSLKSRLMMSRHANGQFRNSCYHTTYQTVINGPSDNHVLSPSANLVSPLAPTEPIRISESELRVPNNNSKRSNKNASSSRNQVFEPSATADIPSIDSM